MATLRNTPERDVYTKIAVIFPQFIVWKLQNDDCSFVNHFFVAMLF